MEGCPARVAELGGYVAETKRAFEVRLSSFIVNGCRANIDTSIETCITLNMISIVPDSPK
jgi:hypothetical protein